MSFLKKIKSNIEIFCHSFIWGLKGADKEIIGTKAPRIENGTSVEKENIKDNVFNDLLLNKETERVKEVRDEMYRIIRESDKYYVTIDFPFFDREDGEMPENSYMKATAVIKSNDFLKKHPLIKERKDKLILIQDQMEFDFDSEDNIKKLMGLETKNNFLINFNYEDFIPKFNLSEFIRRIVVWENKENDFILDLYFNDNQRHFNVKDALFIKNLYNKKSEKNYFFDALDFKEIYFTTFKAHSEIDFKNYLFNNIIYDNISNFDGHYIVSVKAKCKKMGEDILEKFKTEAVDKKYQIKAPKSKTIELDLADRIVHEK